MKILWQVLYGGGRTGFSVDVGLLVLRLWLGLTMAFAFGIHKFPISPQFVSGVADMGFPFPTLFAWCAALSEVVGGTFLAIGLMTRPAAAFLTFTMCVAVFKVKGDLGWFDIERINPTHYLIGFLTLFFTGAGRISVDMILRPKVREQRF